MFRVAWFSCQQTNIPLYAGWQIQKLGCKAAFLQGDTPYINNGWDAWGYDTSSVPAIPTLEQLKERHDQEWANPGFQTLTNSSDIACYYTADDHEWRGDNWDNTIAQATAGAGDSPLTGTITQAVVDEHSDRAIQAIQYAVATYCDNPANTDPEAIAEVPSEADETDASKYPVRYFRIGYDVNGNVDNNNPHVEFFVIDCITYRDPVGTANTILGANQKAWLKKYVNESTATFKLIMSPKHWVKNTSADNTDTMGHYSDERNEIVAAWDAAGVTGRAICSGDRHTPSVINASSDTESFDLLDVTACPVGVQLNVGNTPNLDDGYKWHGDTQVFGVAEIHRDVVYIQVRNARSGKLMKSYPLYAGDNRSEIAQVRTA